MARICTVGNRQNRHPLQGCLGRNFPWYRPQDLPKNHLHRRIYWLPTNTIKLSDATPGCRDQVMSLMEATLLCADEPLTPKKLGTVVGLNDISEVRKIVEQLRSAYEEDGSAFQLEEIAGGFQLLSRPEYARWLVRLRSHALEMRLSPAARETLAIIAYRQPIMRADVEAIRGVHCGETLRQLMDKGLVRIAGRHDSLGRPVLYGTTKKFLQIHGFKNLRDLPPIEEQPSSPKSNPPAEESVVAEEPQPHDQEDSVN